MKKIADGLKNEMRFNVKGFGFDLTLSRKGKAIVTAMRSKYIYVLAKVLS